MAAPVAVVVLVVAVAAAREADVVAQVLGADVVLAVPAALLVDPAVIVDVARAVKVGRLVAMVVGVAGKVVPVRNASRAIW